MAVALIPSEGCRLIGRSLTVLVAFNVPFILLLVLHHCLALAGDVVPLKLSLEYFLIQSSHHGTANRCIVLCALVLHQRRILHHLATQA